MLKLISIIIALISGVSAHNYNDFTEVERMYPLPKVKEVKEEKKSRDNKYSQAAEIDSDLVSFDIAYFPVYAGVIENGSATSVRMNINSSETRGFALLGEAISGEIDDSDFSEAMFMMKALALVSVRKERTVFNLGYGGGFYAGTVAGEELIEKDCSGNIIESIRCGISDPASYSDYEREAIGGLMASLDAQLRVKLSPGFGLGLRKSLDITSSGPQFGIGVGLSFGG